VAPTDARLLRPPAGVVPARSLPAGTVLVHDYLNQHGGAERVLEAFHRLAADAPIFTSLYAPETMPDAYRDWDIHPLWIDRAPSAQQHHQRYLPAYPLAFERLRLPPCRLVLSSSSAFAKMVRPPAGAVHVSYIHSPMRFAWDLDVYVDRERLPGPARPVLRPLMAFMRQRDRATLDRVQRFVANSTAVQARIRAYWRRDASVVHPPVDVERFQPAPAERIQPYFLMVSRLVPYKRFDIAIEAANALELPLWIVGDGRDRVALERLAGPSVRFLGRVSDAELDRLYAECRAAVFMSEDDFGIAQVEAQAAGRPVIAYAAGGALDTVVPDRTGVFVAEQTVPALVDALRRFERLTFDPTQLVRHASRFSVERFEREILREVDEALGRPTNGASRGWN